MRSHTNCAEGLLGPDESRRAAGVNSGRPVLGAHSAQSKVRLPFRRGMSWLCLLVAMATLSAGKPASAEVSVGASIIVDGHDDRVVDSVDVFYEDLSPYGQWVEVGGTRAWRPYASVVGVDFVPYASHGYWVDSDVGWAFESHWDWGWGPFHYGRWSHHPGWGWVWYPGTVWAPAWVEWRVGPAYVGWAPLGVSFAVWGPSWTFVSKRHFARHDFYHYAVPRTRAGVAFRSTSVVRQRIRAYGRDWARGPSDRDIERASGFRPTRAHVTVRSNERQQQRSSLSVEQRHRSERRNDSAQHANRFQSERGRYVSSERQNNGRQNDQRSSSRIDATGPRSTTARSDRDRSSGGSTDASPHDTRRFRSDASSENSRADRPAPNANRGDSRATNPDARRARPSASGTRGSKRRRSTGQASGRGPGARRLRR